MLVFDDEALLRLLEARRKDESLEPLSIFPLGWLFGQQLHNLVGNAP